MPNLFFKASGTGVSQFGGSQTARNENPLTEGMLVKVVGHSTSISCPDTQYKGKKLSDAFNECTSAEDVQKILNDLDEETRNACFFPESFDFVEVDASGNKKSDILKDFGLFNGTLSRSTVGADGKVHKVCGPIADVYHEVAKTQRGTVKQRYDAVCNDARVKDVIFHVHLHSVPLLSNSARSVTVPSFLKEAYDKDLHTYV